MRQHFRRFLLVHGDKGQTLYFRFYDPRILRVFLPGCTPEERIAFFGPISRFVMEAEDPATALEFRNAGKELKKKEADFLPLTETEGTRIKLPDA